MSPAFKRLTLPCVLESAEQARLFVVAEAEEAGLPPEKIFKLELALEELIVNVISYAFSAGEGSVEVLCGVEAGAFVLRIEDAGAAFDPTQCDQPDVDMAHDDRDIGGLGIFLTQQMSDDMNYERRNDQNIMVVKFLL